MIRIICNKNIFIPSLQREIQSRFCKTCFHIRPAPIHMICPGQPIQMIQFICMIIVVLCCPLYNGPANQDCCTDFAKDIFHFYTGSANPGDPYDLQKKCCGPPYCSGLAYSDGPDHLQHRCHTVPPSLHIYSFNQSLFVIGRS